MLLAQDVPGLNHVPKLSGKYIQRGPHDVPEQQYGDEDGKFKTGSLLESWKPAAARAVRGVGLILGDDATESSIWSSNRIG